jgi:hypothetical protein
MTLRAAFAAAAIAFAATSAARADTPDGFRFAPDLAWKRGDHEFQIGASMRARAEYWNAFVTEEDVFGATKTRLRLRYAFRDQLFATVEGQYVQLLGMDSTASGAALVYRNANDGRHDAGQLHLRQAHLEWRPIPELFLRAGRQDVKLGTEVSYTEPDWRYLKTSRLAERLVGNVGWSHVERANDAVTGGYQFAEHRLDAFAARPTTGVFAVDRGMRPLHDIAYGGAIWTVQRGAWVPDTELSLFGIVYDDDRAVSDGGLPDGVRVYTLGASWLGVYEIGPGRFDALLWAAGQLGDFDGDDHRAAAGIVEIGYQLPDVWLAPWLRAGVNVASGDDDPEDGDHETFANLLPTNHLYYGFTDQLAFQNLVNPFVQLRLTPHPRFWMNLFVHWFRLLHRDDAVYAGTGAFDRASFGFPARASDGHTDVGVEYDATATFVLHRSTTLELGFSWLDGGDVFRTRPDRDATFAYASIEVRY